ncbi:hypothetical protein M153_5966000304, partial [Pseudoloma neurophilia]
MPVDFPSWSFYFPSSPDYFTEHIQLILKIKKNLINQKIDWQTVRKTGLFRVKWHELEDILVTKDIKSSGDVTENDVASIEDLKSLVSVTSNEKKDLKSYQP